MRIDTRTIFVPIAPDGFVWLLKRREDKKLFPGLITGIGGKVELSDGEGEDLEAAGRREWEEEVPQLKDSLEDIRLRLVTHDTRGTDIFVLLWFTVKLNAVPTDHFCSEGVLLTLDPENLPFDEMVPTARHAIPFVLGLAEDDLTIYDGLFSPGLKQLVLSK